MTLLATVATILVVLGIAAAVLVGGFVVLMMWAKGFEH